MVDVAANHSLRVVLLRVRRERPLVFADIGNRVFDLELRPLRQRPIAEAERAADFVQDPVERECEIVGLVAQQCEPARLCDHEIEMVAVHDQVIAPVRALVHRVFDHIDAAEMGPVIAAQELVVVARNIDDAASLARLAQELLHHVVMRLRPVPVRLQRPAVDNVADQVDRVGLVPAKEVEQLAGLATAGAKMHVGNEERAVVSRPGRCHQHMNAVRVSLCASSHIVIAV